MKVLYDRSSVAGVFHRPKVTLGTFDGMHVGHQRVIRELITWARATESPALVITFDRKPGRVISGRPFDRITSLPHRLRLLSRGQSGQGTRFRAPGDRQAGCVQAGRFEEFAAAAN